MQQRKAITGVGSLARVLTPLALLICLALPAQNSFFPAGAPFIRNYPPGEYRADGQNWAIAQDQDGIMYFGNSKGVLEYDGVSWRLIETGNKTVIRSLAVDENNRVYVGAYGEIGYLAPDTTGRLQYISLLPFLDRKYHDFSDVWQTVVTSQGVYFGTQKYIFRWAEQQMHVWVAPTVFLHTASVNDQIYVRQWKMGLMKMVSDSLILVPGGEQFDLKRISELLPYPGRDKGRVLICTQTEGLFLYDGRSAVPFPTNFDDALIEARLYQSAKLPNGDYAFATIQDGVFVMDEKGQMRHHLNKATGLQNNTAWCLYPDKQGGLWIGMDAGISRAEINAPLTHFDNRQGVEGNVLDIVRHQGMLYIATSTGVFFLDEKKGTFKPISGLPPQCWKLLSVGQSLLGGTFQGIYEIRGNQAHSINPAYAFYLYRSQQDTNRVFVGLQQGLRAIYYTGGQWRDEGVVDGIAQEIRDMLETPDGMLWMTTRYQGLLRADFSGGFSLQPSIVRVDTLQGLPPGDRAFAFTTTPGLRFATPGGIYLFDKKQQRFLADTALIKGFPNRHAPIYSVAQDRKENLWLLIPEGSGSGIAVHQADGIYAWDESPLLRANHADLNIVYPDPLYEKLTWFGGNDRLIRYDASAPKNYRLDFRTLIRQVIVNGDSLIYSGAGRSAGEIIKLTYAQNSLRLMYAAPCFDDESRNEYQYFLEGYDEGWSKWSTESRKDYTNLPEGNYRFMVRAKNIYQHIGEAAVFEFRVQPPFYRSWWAYLLYALLLAGVLYFFREREMKRIKKKYLRELEQLEYDKLKELDQLKSRFFADISHEFRTPLTVILGMVNALKKYFDSGSKPEHDQVTELVRRNSRQLLELVNQLLDLARLESGKLQLSPANGDLAAFLHYQLESFQSYSQTRQIALHFHSERPHLEMAFDHEKIQTILINLISNAIKFTPEGGRIDLGLTTYDLRLDAPERQVASRQSQVVSRQSSIVIQVTDTGIGIPEDHLSRIFDRFYQVDDSTTRKGEGTGIGLAVVYELVKLMQGTITVESKPGAGTSFRITLPYTPQQPQLPAYTDSMKDQEAPIKPAVAQFEDETEDDHRPLLLLVEDNPDVRFYIAECTRNEYRLAMAENGAEGIQKATALVPDIIISDVMMPEKDGFELCETLKNDELTSHIPIVLLTARADFESRIAGLRRGADAYLAKPFHPEELQVTLSNLLAVRKALQLKYKNWESVDPTAPDIHRVTLSHPVNTSHPVNATADLEHVFLQKVVTHLDQYGDDAGFGVPQLSRKLGLSQSQLYRKVKALTDLSTVAFIRRYRLQKGKHLLTTTDLTISEIAYEVGFSSLSYFSDAFFEEFGIRPNTVRN